MVNSYDDDEFLLFLMVSGCRMVPETFICCLWRSKSRAYARGVGVNPLELDILQKLYYKESV